MRRAQRSWKTMGMLAVLGVVVYQGFLVSTRFEVEQARAELGVAAPREERTSFHVRGDAAPLYTAAGRLPALRHSSSQVSLQDFRRDRAAFEQSLGDQQLTFDLLRRASQQSHCDFALEEVNYLDLRRLVQVASLQMMRLAEQGQIPQACALARDVKLMIERLDESPIALRHAVSLSFSEQLALTAEELDAAYPGQGFELLIPDMADLAKSLEAGFAASLRYERDFVVGEFQKSLAGERRGALRELTELRPPTDLQVYQVLLEYLRTSRQIESAFTAGDEAAMAKALAECGHPIAAAMTPNWPVLARRHREVVRQLRSFRRDQEIDGQRPSALSPSNTAAKERPGQ